MLQDKEIYELVGEEGFRRLVAEFYTRVPTDPVLGPMYPPGDLAGAQERLSDFLLFRFGGISRYTEKRGHPRLRMRHAHFHIDKAARDRWMRLMMEALAVAAIPAEAASALEVYFSDTATFMINRSASNTITID
jgi:hemoglobin